MGAYLRRVGCVTINTHHPTVHSTLASHPCWYLPHDYGDQPHDDFIETVKEVLEGLALLPHAPDDQTEADGEHHQAQRVDPINQPRDWDHLLPGDHLAAVECEYCVVHCHRHVDYSLGILRLELGRGRVEERLIHKARICS